MRTRKQGWRNSPRARRGATRNFRSHRQRGQSVVEMSLVLPVFLVIILGTIEVGRLWWTQQVLTSAARQGLRMATQNDMACPPNKSSGTFFIQQEVHRHLRAMGLSDNQQIVQVTADEIAPATGRIKLRITYHYDSLLPFLPGLLSQTTVNAQGDKVLVTEAIAACEP